MNLRDIADAALAKVAELDFAADAFLPPGFSLEEHFKHCRARPNNCPFLRAKDRVDSDLPDGVLQPEELLQIYKAEGVSDRLVEETERYGKAVECGIVEARRLPNEVFSLQTVMGVPEWMLAAYHIASARGVSDSLATDILRDVALTADRYFEDALQSCEDAYGASFDEGREAKVFSAGRFVVKASALSLMTTGTIQKIERVLLGNIIFPESPYEVLAVGGGVNKFCGPANLLFILAQPRVKFQSEGLTRGEVDEFMRIRGFSRNPLEDFAYISPECRLKAWDMHNRNVVRSHTGEIVCIDSCVLPSTYKFKVSLPKRGAE